MPGTALVTRNVQPILEKLQGVAGCPRLVHFDPARQELTLKEFGGVPLGQSDYLGTDNLERFLAIAEALARTLAAIQERGVIHKALNPTNILIRPDDLQVQIVGFDLATTIAEDPLPLDRLNCLPSDLAYVSPEQTGRMNRRVDHRTDLYSLGATLYALATGTPPFEDTDPLALIHAHLARTPKSPKIRAHWLPSRLSEVILILLAKEPNNRYQSAAGLVYDLQQVRHALSTPVRLERMQLQTHDLPLSPRQPHRLCGRERELATLMEAFTSVATGGAQGLFVAGYSGVGKTALVYELQRPVLLAHGRFFHGKFEQFQRDRSFLAPYQCLRQLCQVLLAEPEAAIAHWREQILAGLGPDAAALYEVVPDLELLLGPCPPAPKLGPIETQVRLLALLVALIRQIAMRGHPLVLFLDDLQWADQPSLDFMGALMEDSALDGLLLIGAYRDNEVDAAHPLRYLLRRPTASGTPPPVLTLASLTGGNLDALLADMLQTKPAEVQTLAAALFAKTHGNPLFTIVFLNNLYRQGALRPDPKHGRWQWDPAAILALADATKDTVVAAACLGIECTLGLLMLATALEPDELTEQLLPALERGIIITSDAIAFHRTDPDTLLWFCHDRMQQAVCQIRDDVWQGQLHLAMARRFAQAGDDPNLRLLAAEHYAASPSIIEATERPNVRKLLLAGAVKARQLGDFARAEHFLRQAIQLLYPDIRQSDYGEALILHTELHVALYSQSRYDAADSVYALLEDHTQEPVALVKSACVQIASLSNRTRYAESIQLGLALLERLGIAVPGEELESTLETELTAFYDQVEKGDLEALPNAPLMRHAPSQGAAKLMNHMISVAFFSQPLLSFWLVLRIIRLGMERGFSEDLLYPATSVIIATVALRGDYALGYRAARMAMTACLAHDSSVESARAHHEMALLNSHWFNPLAEDIDLARAAFQGLLRGGDLEEGCYTYFSTQAALLDTSAKLSELAAETRAALSFAVKTGNSHAEQTYLVFRQLVRALAGETLTPGSFDDLEFNEAAHLATVKDNPMALCYFHIYRALAACLFNDDAALIHHAEAGATLEGHIVTFYPTALSNFLHSLALIQQIRTGVESDQDPLLAELAINQDWLRARAADAPMNFSHLYLLVEAERLDVKGQRLAAFHSFEQAMGLARTSQRPWHLALITERAGHCFLRNGLEQTSRPFLVRACELYRQWGAEGKALAMRRTLPFVDFDHHGDKNIFAEVALDKGALLQASQVLASERSLPKLVARMLTLVGELTGATNVQFLLLDGANEWHMEGGLKGDEPLGRMTLQEAEKRGILAASVFRLGIKTKSHLVSDDAVEDNRFWDDPHYAYMPCCSLLALPLALNGRISAFLILENCLFRAAFTATKVETASILCRQLAISIENVQLNQLLEEKVAERTRALKETNRRLEARTTEAHAANVALQVTQESLLFVVEGSRLGTYDWNIKTGEVKRNEYWAESLCYQRDDIDATIGAWLDLIHPDDRDLVWHSTQEVLARQTGLLEIEYRMRASDGSYRWICDRGRVVTWNAEGQALRMSGTHEDITSRKYAQEKLRLSEERHRLIAQNASDVIWTLSFDGKLTYVSPSVEKLRGFTVDEVMRQSWEEIFTPGSLSLFLRNFRDFHDNYSQDGFPPESWRLELEQWHKDGSIVWTEVLASPLIGADGTFLEILGVSRDISERKRYEDKLLQARIAAESANRAKSQFLSHMSHEIRTPLYSVLGLAQMINREPLNARQRDMVGRINDAGQSLLGIISDIQDLSRIEAGKIEFEYLSFDLMALLSKLNNLLGPKASDEGLELHIEASGVPPGMLQGDELRLEQVLMNLIGNAIKFTTNGKITVGVKPIELTGKSARLRFEIIDTGIGIAPDVLPVLFKPFTQGDGSITRRFGGTGLGLAISKQLVVLMGGRIGVESQIGVGSNFWFELPFMRDERFQEDLSVLPALVPAPGLELQGFHCLVVDDSDTHRELMKQALEWAGALITTATDGQQAIQFLKRQPGDFDIVLMDMQMPVMDGLTAIRLIRDQLKLVGLPIVAVTAGVLPEQRQAALKAGSDMVITKPVDMEQIAALLRRRLIPQDPRSGEFLESTSILHTALPEPASAPVPAAEELFPIVSGINHVKAAKLLCGNQEMFRKFLNGFASKYARVVEQTHHDLNHGERESAARHMHNLRGYAGSICAMDLMEKAGAMEEAIRKGDTDLDDGLMALNRQIQDLITASAPWRR